MKKLKRIVSGCWPAVVLLGLVGPTGCISEEEIEREFQANRQRSYEILARVDDDPNNAALLATAGGELSMSRGMELALAHNKDVQTTRLRLMEAEGQVLEARSTALPEVTLSGSAMKNDSDVMGTEAETYDWQVLARQPLYLGGLSRAAIDAAAVFAYMTGQELRQTLQRVELEVRRVYLAALLARSLEEVTQKAKEDAKENLRLVRAKYRQGDALKFEVLRSEVRLRAIEAELIQRHNEYTVRVAELLNVIGVSQLSAVELTDRLEYEPAAVAEGDCLWWAMKYRPDLLIGESMIRLARDNVISERSSNRPKLYLQGTYREDKPGFGSSFTGQGGGWDKTMSGGLTLEWTAFDGLKTDGRVIQAKAELRKQEVALKKQEQQVQLEVTQALLDLQSSDEFVQSQMGNVSNAGEALRLAQVNFREGAGTSLDVISAELALATARSDYISAMHDYELAQLNLSAAVGTIGEQELPGLEGEGVEPMGEAVPSYDDTE